MVIIVRYLTAAEYEVVSAYSGLDGLRKAKAQKPDLILTDLQMPDVSGVLVIQALKADPETQHLPVVAVSAHTWGMFTQAARDAGCDGHLSKPFTSKRLIEAVQRYLNAPNP